jgi:hypothetical protein
VLEFLNLASIKAVSLASKSCELDTREFSWHHIVITGHRPTSWIENTLFNLRHLGAFSDEHSGSFWQEFESWAWHVAGMRLHLTILVSQRFQQIGAGQVSYSQGQLGGEGKCFWRQGKRAVA